MRLNKINLDLALLIFLLVFLVIFMKAIPVMATPQASSTQNEVDAFIWNIK